MIGVTLGGLGLFLLGMHLLTATLKDLAGDTLRSIMHRFTRTLTMAVAFGAGATALLQSSSAVTLVTLGFVSAGLLPFRRALGIMYGANLGTTATAWIIAVVGLKVPLDTYAMPLVGIGALLGVLGKGRVSGAGLALAAFGLIFVGIDTLQTGLSGLGDAVDPARFARPGVAGVLILVALGTVMTVVLQSSSAAVATTLAAVHAGTISFEQAAALAIGQNVGTTVKALLGSAGGQTAARRVALGHITFNLVTGLVALILLPLFVTIVLWLGDQFDVHDPAVSLAIFHTVFNAVGVAIFVPITPRFADWIERMTPSKHTSLTQHLRATEEVPVDVRLEMARSTLLDLSRAAIARAAAPAAMPKSATKDVPDPESFKQAIGSLRDWLKPLQQDKTTEAQNEQHRSMLDALDHLGRFVARLERVPENTQEDVKIDGWLQLLDGWVQGHPGADMSVLIEETEALHHRVRKVRSEVLTRTAAGRLGVTETTQALDALRWCEALAQHGFSLATRLRGAGYFDHPLDDPDDTGSEQEQPGLPPERREVDRASET